MIIDGTDGNARTTHDTFICEKRDVGSDIVGNSGAIQIGNIDSRRHWNWTCTHAAITTDAHIDLEADLVFSEGAQVNAMFDTHHILRRLYLHECPPHSPLIITCGFSSGVPQVAQKRAILIFEAPQL